MPAAVDKYLYADVTCDSSRERVRLSNDDPAKYTKTPMFLVLGCLSENWKNTQQIRAEVAAVADKPVSDSTVLCALQRARDAGVCESRRITNTALCNGPINEWREIPWGDA